MNAPWLVPDDEAEEEASATAHRQPRPAPTPTRATVRRLAPVTTAGPLADGGRDIAPTWAAEPAVTPAAGDATVSTVNGLHHEFGVTVRRAAEQVPLEAADVNEVVESAVWLVAAGRAAEASPIAETAGRVLASSAVAGLPGGARRPVDWSGFGALVPVVAGSPGAGASVVAAALADALQCGGRCVLLVDAADPARSGLAGAAAADGPWTHHAQEALTIRYSWRDRAVLARLESRLPMVTAGMVPPPPDWLPPLNPLHATVVDVGHDGWRAAADPLVGAGGWLRFGTPVPRPVLVVRATRPSLRHAEQVLARLDPWIAARIAVPPCQLVVNGARRWPPGVAGAAGQRVASLLADALFVPHHHDVEVGGVTDVPLPHRVVDALAPLLRQWGLLPPDGQIVRARKGRRS